MYGKLLRFQLDLYLTVELFIISLFFSVCDKNILYIHTYFIERKSFSLIHPCFNIDFIVGNGISFDQ